jgi:hypothetical protein
VRRPGAARRGVPAFLRGAEQLFADPPRPARDNVVPLPTASGGTMSATAGQEAGR